MGKTWDNVEDDWDKPQNDKNTSTENENNKSGWNKIWDNVGNTLNKVFENVENTLTGVFDNLRSMFGN